MGGVYIRTATLPLQHLATFSVPDPPLRHRRHPPWPLHPASSPVLTPLEFTTTVGLPESAERALLRQHCRPPPHWFVTVDPRNAAASSLTAASHGLPRPPPHPPTPCRPPRPPRLRRLATRSVEPSPPRAHQHRLSHPYVTSSCYFLPSSSRSSSPTAVRARPSPGRWPTPTLPQILGFRDLLTQTNELFASETFLIWTEDLNFSIKLY
jgi:hypothetical protein